PGHYTRPFGTQSWAATAARTSIHAPVTQQPRARDTDGHHHRCADENARLRPAMGKTIAVDHRPHGLAKVEMQRGGRAASRLGDFGNMDRDTTVQEVEAESKHAVDGDLPHPWDMQRNEDEPGCGKCAAGNHQMALAHTGDENRNRERIEN